MKKTAFCLLLSFFCFNCFAQGFKFSITDNHFFVSSKIMDFSSKQGKKEIMINYVNGIGIGFIITGVLTAGIGAALIVSDMTNISDLADNALYYAGYKYYSDMYKGFLIGGILALVAGGILMICSIPMLVFRDELLAFNIEVNNGVSLLFSCKF